jgi:hypothetical protein
MALQSTNNLELLTEQSRSIVINFFCLTCQSGIIFFFYKRCFIGEMLNANKTPKRRYILEGYLSK